MQTHNRLTAKLCLTETSVSCAVELSDSEGQQHNIHTHTTKTQKKKPESWDELSKPPATQSLSSRARVTTHTNLETHVCVHPQSEADETTITADGLILPHTHTHIHNSNLPSANNRAVCGEKRKGGVEWHEEQIRQIMVEGNAVRCWTGFIYSDKHE